MIYVHIGLHKTATSSLQKSVFPNLTGVHFIGRFNSQKNLGIKESDILYGRICDFCFSASLEKDKIKDIQDLISIEERKHGNLLLSEEWFTSDLSGFYGYSGCKWQDSIDRLLTLLGDKAYKILVTIRKPHELIYSQYCEFKKTGSAFNFTNIMEYVNNSNDAQAFDFYYLKSCLQGSNVNFITFDQIKDGSWKNKLEEFFSLGSLPNIGHEYASVKVNGKVELEVPSIFYYKVSMLFSEKLKMHIRSYSLFKLIFKFRRLVSKKKYIPRLSESEKKQIKEKYKESYEIYQKYSDR